MHSHQQVLLMLKGHPGSGKTSLARAVASKFAWPIADKDDARDCFSQQVDALEEDITQLAYDIMFKVAETQLKIGISVVIDCPLARLELYERAERLAQKYQVHLVLVECSPKNEAVWRERLESRGRLEKDSCTAHKPTDWEQLQQLLDRYNGCWKWSSNTSIHIPHRIELDTSTLSPKAAADSVANYLMHAGMLNLPN